MKHTKGMKPGKGTPAKAQGTPPGTNGVGKSIARAKVPASKKGIGTYASPTQTQKL